MVPSVRVAFVFAVAHKIYLTILNSTSIQTTRTTRMKVRSGDAAALHNNESGGGNTDYNDGGI